MFKHFSNGSDFVVFINSLYHTVTTTTNINVFKKGVPTQILLCGAFQPSLYPGIDWHSPGSEKDSDIYLSN